MKMNSDRFARYPSLQGRVIFITGGGSGIGASIVEQFAQQGARVAFVDRAQEESQQLVQKLAKAIHPPLFLPCDLTDIAALRDCMKQIEEKLGTIRVLVNNAASDDRHKLTEVTPEYWDERIAVNLRHHFFTIQAVVPGMTSVGGGSIINMSSIRLDDPFDRIACVRDCEGRHCGTYANHGP